MVNTRSADVGPVGLDTLMPIAVEPAHLNPVVAGSAGAHSTWLLTFGTTVASTEEAEALALLEEWVRQTEEERRQRRLRRRRATPPAVD